MQSIEIGINRVFGAFALNQILVFEDLHGFLDELQSYSRELDEMGEPTEKIEAKERRFRPSAASFAARVSVPAPAARRPAQ